ncbi:MAG: Asp-tRNA(Asn)/Glu-tRNA(Gln) amidotransferase subunit GatC [Solitalea sp.]
MRVSKSTVEKMAHLARLEVENMEKMQEDMSRILDFMDKLNELDTDQVAPLIYLNDEVNVTRPDETGEELSREDALKNAPDTDGTFFKVAKVIDL